MKPLIVWLIGVGLLFSLVPHGAGGAELKMNGPFPSVSLPPPENPAHKAYLGLSKEGVFGLSQIKTRVVIIEIFSMYCPHCQREAPYVNELYQKIEASPSLKEKLKIVGIGVGNTPFEVEVFRKKYQVPFPLFPDPDFAVHKAVGEVRTPCFIGVRLDEAGATRVFFQRVGGLEGVDGFLELMLKESGIDQEK